MVDYTLLVKRWSLILFGILTTEAALAQSEVHRSENLIPNSSVNRVEHSNGYTMLSGGFNLIGAYSGSGILTDVATGLSIDPAMPKVDGSIYASVPDGSGGFFIGGYFSYIDTVKVRNLAHIKADKSVDRTWKPNPDNSPTVLYVNGTTLYVGGYFNTIAGQTRNNIASFDLATGNVTAWNPDTNGSVQAIQVLGTTVYLGGYFTTVGGLARQYLAAVNTTTGLPTTWVLTPNSGVLALAVDGGSNTIFAGGTFSSVGASLRTGIARLSLAGTGSVVAWTANTSALGYVNNLIISGTALYMSGSFTTVNGVARTSLAAVTIASGALLSFNPVLTAGASVDDIDIVGTTVYLAGYFDTVNLTSRNGLAAVDAATGTLLAWAPQTNNSVTTVAATASGVFVGGYFNGANWSSRTSFALLETATDELWPFSFDLNGGFVNTIAVKDNTLYIGGQFNAINKTPRRNLAAFDLTTGALLAWNPLVFGTSTTDPDVFVSAMMIKDNNLYFGGKFYAVNTAGTVRPGLASVDLSTGVVSTWNPAVGDGKTTSQYVNSIDISGNTLYAAGNFSLLSGSQPRNNLAAIDVTNAAILAWNPNSSGEVSRIRVTASTAYVAGNFTGGIGSPSVSRTSGVAAVNLASNSVNAWNPDFHNGFVYDVAIGGTDVYVAGNYDSIANSFKPGLASFNHSTGVLNDWTPDIGDSDGGYSVHILSASSSRLFVGGDFSYLGEEARQYYAEYNTCPAKPVITINGYLLETTATGDLQWYMNGVLAEGATGQTFEVNPFEYAVYSVSVTEGGCSTSSDDFAYLITGSEVAADQELQVYPNPVTGELHVDLHQSDGDTKFSFIDMMGRPMKQMTGTGSSHRLSVQDLESGPYILRVTTKDSQYFRKIIKVK